MSKTEKEEEEDVCASKTYDWIKKECGISKADKAKGRCKTSVSSNECYKECLVTDTGTCKGFSTRWPPGYNIPAKFLTTDNKCIDIPEPECPVKKYRKTPGGECLPIPSLLTCSDYNKKEDLGFGVGETLDEASKLELCPNDDEGNSLCNNKICKSRIMTCGEKNAEYKPSNPCQGSKI